MNRLLIVLFGIVSTVAVLVLLLLLYRYANQNEKGAYMSPLEKQMEHRAYRVESGRKWLQDLAAKKKPSYSYAVSEMEIDLPLRKKPEPKTAYRLVLNNLDNYKMFCVRQLLEQNGIEYAFFRKRSNGVLVIRDLKKKDLHRIIGLVKKYDVDVEIENYTKD